MSKASQVFEFNTHELPRRAGDGRQHGGPWKADGLPRTRPHRHRQRHGRTAAHDPEGRARQRAGQVRRPAPTGRGHPPRAVGRHIRTLHPIGRRVMVDGPWLMVDGRAASARVAINQPSTLNPQPFQ